MKPDHIDALAAELFAAAREERPDRALVARVERATASSADGTVAAGEHFAPTEPRSGGGAPRACERPPTPEVERDVERARGRRLGRWRRPSLVSGLLAALVSGGVAALVLLPRTRDAVVISAERAPGGPAARPATRRGTEGAAGDERARHGGPSPREASPGSAAPNGDGVAGTERSPAAEPGQTPGLEPAPSATDRSLRRAPARGARALQTGTASRSMENAPAPPRAAPARSARPEPTGPAPAEEQAPAASTSATLSNELGVLKQIRQALRNGDGSAALALLERYDTGELGRSLAPEASVLRIEALDAVGRRADAEVLARRFVRDNRDSPLAERVQRFIDRSEPAEPAPGSPP